jgi:putative NADH-flavin reductase
MTGVNDSGRRSGEFIIDFPIDGHAGESQMNIALIGATGFIGTALRKEALERGYRVTAIVRDASKLEAAPNLMVAQVDIQDQAALAGAIKGQDAVISAFSGPHSAEQRRVYLSGVRSIIAAAKETGRRLLMVGGAASLEVAPGKLLIDEPDFPPAWKDSAAGARDALHLLRAETALDWTMFSPAAMISPGPRTGKYRLGTDQLIVGENGKSEISTRDYAKAMIDELEKPAHRRSRFTIGY